MKSGKPEDILDRLRPGQRIFFQGGPGECATFFDLLNDHPGASRGAELWSCLVPGMNTRDYGSLPDGPSLVTFMASPTLEASIATGRTRIDAMPYSGIGETLATTDFDIAILHTSMPDAQGRCSFGISSEAAPLVLKRSKQVIAFTNHRMPTLRDEFIPTASIDLAIEIDAPLLSAAPSGARSTTVEALARHAAVLIPDHATIQSGIGEAPGAVIDALKTRRGLRIHSGLITPDYRLLAEAGALDASHRHITGIAWGDADFYDWLPESGISFRSIRETHGLDHVAANPNFVSIGSALEVDLAGNVNLEWAGKRRISSVGGAPDYVRAATVSPGGRSIIAFPATTRSGASRIVAKLDRPSISGELADAIVTEHGVAELRSLSTRACAAALITIAAPEHREALERYAAIVLGNP